MRLSKTSAQAMLALAYLSQQKPGVVTQARQVAVYLGIPTDSALKILQVLARQEIILSHLGRSGGYRLIKSPAQITLAQIVEVIDGPIIGSTRLSTPRADMAESLDRLQTICNQVAEQIRRQLGHATVSDLIVNPANVESPSALVKEAPVS